MDSIFSCPGCGKRLRIPEDYLGKTIRCRACGGAVDTRLAASDPVRPGREDEGRGDDAPPLKLGARVIDDPGGRLRGVYPGELGPGGLLLSRKGDGVEIPRGVPVEYLGRDRIALPLEGQVVTLSLSRMGAYPDRLTRGVAAYLSGRAGMPDAADYKIPGLLMLLAFLPVGILAAGLQGGAIGGAIGGAFGGGLLALNFAIVRRERWPVGARVGACLGVNVVGYAILILGLVAILRPPRQGNAPAAPEPVEPPRAVAGVAPAPTAWGTPEDPLGDCRIEVREESATIEVPGTVHDLGATKDRDKAPRIMRPAEGDFVAEVRVVGDVRPTEPAAPPGDVAFQGAGLLLRGEVDGLIRLERAAFVRGGVLRSYILLEHHKPVGPMDAQVGEYPGGPVVLRLERRGPGVVGSYSVDGTTWQRLRSITYGDARPTVGVAAVNTSSASFLAEFRGFRMERP